MWGDFDVDGQTATALLVATLADLGAAVSYHVPVRETESHGVNLPSSEAGHRSGRPDHPHLRHRGDRA